MAALTTANLIGRWRGKANFDGKSRNWGITTFKEDHTFIHESSNAFTALGIIGEKWNGNWNLESNGQILIWTNVTSTPGRKWIKNLLNISRYFNLINGDGSIAIEYVAQGIFQGVVDGLIIIYEKIID